MKRTTSIFLIIIFLIGSKSYGQAVENTHFISLEILNDSLQFDPKEDTAKVITLKFTNTSNVRLLTYDLSSSLELRRITFNSSELCKLDDVGSGLGQILYNSKGEQLFPSVWIKHRAGRKPMTRPRLDSILRNSTESFFQDTVVFKRFTSKTFKKKIDIHNYELDRGTYYIQIIFFCGKRIALNKNEEDRFARDCKNLNATLYQGCAISNKIKIIVN